MVVYSHNEEQHLKDHEELFQCLGSASLMHAIFDNGIQTDFDKMKVVNDFPVPKKVKEVQRFLGLAG